MHNIRPMKKYDLEDRLVNFSLKIMEVVNEIPKTINGINLANQLSRSGTSVSLNYGEAQSAESRKDFIHKMKVVLKELRETKICLSLMVKSNLLGANQHLLNIENENNELISIFVKSIETARRNGK